MQSRAQQYQSTIGRLNQEVSSLRQQLDVVSTYPIDGRVAALEADNAALTRDAEATRRQYERCLDDVANQVVRALLAQKVKFSLNFTNFLTGTYTFEFIESSGRDNIAYKTYQRSRISESCFNNIAGPSVTGR